MKKIVFTLGIIFLAAFFNISFAQVIKYNSFDGGDWSGTAKLESEKIDFVHTGSVQTAISPAISGMAAGDYKVTIKGNWSGSNTMNFKINNTAAYGGDAVGSTTLSGGAFEVSFDFTTTTTEDKYFTLEMPSKWMGHGDNWISEIIIEGASATLSTSMILNESNIDGAQVTVDIERADLVDPITESNITLIDAPAGVTVASVERQSATQMYVNLAHDGSSWNGIHSGMAVKIAASENVRFVVLETQKVNVLAATDELPAFSFPAEESFTTWTTNGAILNTNNISFPHIDSQGQTCISPVIENLPMGDYKLIVKGKFHGSEPFTFKLNTTAAYGGTTLLSFTTPGSDATFEKEVIFTISEIEAQYLTFEMGGKYIGPEENIITEITIKSLTSAEISSSLTLNETNIDGAQLTVDLTNTEFVESLDKNKFFLNSAPTGVSIESVVRQSATQAYINLAKSEGDFDVTTDMSVTVGQTQNSSFMNFKSDAFTVLALNDPEELTVSGTLTEENLDAATITVDISGGYFIAGGGDIADQLTGNNVTVTGLEGVSIESIGNKTATSFTIDLAFDGVNDFDTEQTLTVTVSPVAFTDATGDTEITSDISITATDDAEEISLSTGDLTEANLAAASITVNLTGGNFIEGQVFPMNVTITNNAGTGVDKNTVSYIDANTIKVDLSHDATDFDEDATVTVTVKAGAVNDTEDDLTVDLVLPATVEPEITPATVQNIKVDSTGTELTVTTNLTVDSYTWKYGTVSGTYDQTIADATTATYSPMFETAGTYYLVCEIAVGAETYTTNEIEVVVSEPVSVSQINAFAQLAIYPNPSQGIVNIKAENPISSIIVYDIMGQAVKTVSVANQNNISIDLSNNAKGIYFVKVNGNSQTITRKVIIK